MTKAILTILATLGLLGLTLALTGILYGLMTKRPFLTRRWGLIFWVALVLFLLSFGLAGRLK